MMTTGASKVRRDEVRLQQFHIQVLATCRTEISPESWNHHLQSPFWRVYRFSKSGASIVWDGGQLAMAPGRIILIPAWVRFATATTRTMDHEHVHFEVHGLLPGWLKQAFFSPLVLPASPALSALVGGWLAELDQADRHPFPGFIWAGALAQAALVMGAEVLPARARERLYQWITTDPLLQPAVEALESRPTDPLRNAEMASICGMGSRQFMRRFKKTTGLTPGQFRLERRILTTARWLVEGNRTIEDIAEAAGFTDRFHFSRTFKSRLGVSPAAYRAEHQAERG